MENINIITEKIINAVYKVSNTLGSGFLEKVYENAIVYQMRKDGLSIEQQKTLTVLYDNIVVGKYYPDLIVEGKIIVELKAAKQLENYHMAQVLNYLKASKLKLGLLINMGTSKVEIKRIANNL